jgi:protein-tyrosine-phosphatase
MRPESSLLFVCAANLYRSQLAHACSSRVFGIAPQSASSATAAPHLEFSSAGIIADTSLSTPLSVYRALLARGILWTPRPARRLRAEFMHDADVVLAMEEEQVARIRTEHPRSWRKVTTLGAFGAAARQAEPTAVTLQERLLQLLEQATGLPGKAHCSEFDVKDPATEGDAAVETCLSEIESHLSHVAQCVLI